MRFGNLLLIFVCSFVLSSHRAASAKCVFSFGTRSSVCGDVNSMQEILPELRSNWNKIRISTRLGTTFVLEGKAIREKYFLRSCAQASYNFRKLEQWQPAVRRGTRLQLHQTNFDIWNWISALSSAENIESDGCGDTFDRQELVWREERAASARFEAKSAGIAGSEQYVAFEFAERTLSGWQQHRIHWGHGTRELFVASQTELQIQPNWGIEQSRQFASDGHVGLQPQLDHYGTWKRIEM